MADPIVNFFKSTLVGTYSDTDTSLTIATGDGALLPNPSTDGAFNLTIFEGLQVTGSTTFEIVRVTARSGDILTVTRGQESTTPLTIGSATHSILMSATKKTFDDINDAIANVDLITLTGVEELTFDSTGDEEFGLPAGTTAQRPSSPSAGYMRWNSTLSRIEFYNGSRWAGLSEIGLEQVSLGVAQLSVTANDAVAENIISYSFQGSVSGYTSGGPVDNAVIDKFSFTSDGNATDVGDLTQARTSLGGCSSETHGYSGGGSTNGTNRVNTIDKFPFATDSNATDVGDLVEPRRWTQSSQSTGEKGYICGGDNGGPRNRIDRISFTSDGNATDVGDLTQAMAVGGGQSSSTHGYRSGGDTQSGTGTAVNVIDKFSFSAEGNATDVGDLTVSRSTMSTQSSTTHGYSGGGETTPGITNVIDKFSFSSDGNATDVGDITVSRRYLAGQSSTTHGYASSGLSSVNENIIEKFSFSSDENGADVGDLTVARHGSAGQQV